MPPRRTTRSHWLALLALPLVLTACSTSTAAPSGSGGTVSAGAPITLALITSLTGQAASEFSSAPAGFNARIDLQNAEGGVNGHKLVPLVIDDQTSPGSVVSAVQEALSKGAFGVVSDSPIFYFAAKYPKEQGVPVTGGYFDGPEWGEEGYTNMFAADNGSVDPNYPVNTGMGGFIAQNGGTVLGSYGYNISPSSTQAAIGTSRSFTMSPGTSVGVLDTNVPFGGTDFTSEALIAKQKNVDAIVGNLDNSSNFALATAMRQAGVDLKVALFPTGYEPGIVNSPAWSSVQGDYFQSLFRPFSLPNAGTRQMAAALHKYAQFKKGQFPTFTQYESWLGADLMIKGLQVAGKTPTRTAVINDLRGLQAYNGDGLLPITIDYSTIFGHDPPWMCIWYLKAQSSGFVPVSPAPFCGQDVPGSSTLK